VFPSSTVTTNNFLLCSSDYCKDLFSFDSKDKTNTWTALSVDFPMPSGRSKMGFTATPDNKLFVFGGYSSGYSGEIDSYYAIWFW
jgi:hypothetical protein